MSEKPVISSGERFDSILPSIKWYEYNEERSAPKPTKKQQRPWRRKIKECCEDAGTYRPFFDPMIDTLAGIMETRDMAEKLFIDFGGWSVKNPALVPMKVCNAQALEYWEELGLTSKSFWEAIETL